MRRLAFFLVDFTDIKSEVETWREGIAMDTQPAKPVANTWQGEFPYANLLTDGCIPRNAVKGGSHLTASNYCLPYRPAARQSQMIDKACEKGKPKRHIEKAYQYAHRKTYTIGKHSTKTV